MTPTDQAPPLTFAGRYLRLHRLGTGGMARVFLAEDETLGRRVAIKQLPSGAPEEALRRFRREARLGASLNHPNVVSIFDTVSDEDSVLIVMEYVEGESLADRLKRGALGTDETLSILRQVSDALDHAHHEGVVHRDVKPSNILLASEGTVKLADLGIARAIDASSITGSGAIIGTLAYIAPERLRGRPAEAAADVYALAAVAFEMLSGRRARPERTPEEVLEQLDSGDVPDLRDAVPGAPEAAATLIARGMDADPAKRPASAGSFVAALEHAFRGDEEPTVVSGPTVVAERLRPTLERETDRPTSEPASFVPPPIHPRRQGTRLIAPAALGIAAAILIGILVLAGGGGDEKGSPTASKQKGAEKRQNAGNGGGGQAESQSTSTVAPAPATAAAPPQPAPAEGSSTAATAPAGASGAALNSQGYALIQEGRYEEAVPILQQAVDSFPSGTSDLNYAYALFNLGNALRLAGRPAEAIPILERRLQIPDQTATVRRELGLARRDAASGG